MARVLITGSSDGLGLAAAHSLFGEGHDVVLHARSNERAAEARAAAPGVADAVIGDLAIEGAVRSVAD